MEKEKDLVTEATTKRLVINMKPSELRSVQDFISSKGSEVNKDDLSWTIKNFLFELSGLDKPLTKKDNNKRIARERYWANKNKAQ